MRERLRIFLLLALLWLSFMIIARVLFLGYNYDLSSALTFKEIALSMAYGLRMDASICGYFMAAYGLLLTISCIRNKLWIAATIRTLTIILVLICSLIAVIDMELYRHWGFRLNTTPFLYIGKEAAGTVPIVVYLRELFILFVLAGVFIAAYRRKIHPYVQYMSETKTKNAFYLLGLSVAMFLPIRGSFTVAPMNPGFVYFHNTKPFANHAAVNVVWNFLRSLKEGSAVKYSDKFFDKEKTERLFADLYPTPAGRQTIFDSENPNIILIILESFTADVVEPLGGIKSLTPNLNALCREGILFDSIYASGDRTDKGLVSILSGYPAQPRTSIVKYPAKSQNLPLLNRELMRLKYHTSFIYGGDVDFAYFRSYLNTSGFQHITDLDDFDDALYTSKWGVHDHHMFARAQQELDTAKQKFFKVILTLSSHEPFDVPGDRFIIGNDEEALFLNSCHYTDTSLGNFISYCKKQEWWANTVIILTADHGHREPGNKPLHTKQRFRIPLLMIGGAIEKDTVVHTIGSQTDIANTLLSQLNKFNPQFQFSKDLLSNNVRPFAAYFFNDGYGFVAPNVYLVYDNAGQQFIVSQGNSPENVDISKAYQQKLFSTFNNMEQIRSK